MDLILIRHADAAAADGYSDDALRPLTARGRREQEAVTRVLAKMQLRLDRILCSPRVRAYETAEITALGLGMELPEEHGVLDGGYSAVQLVEALQEYAPDLSVCCVGHEPDISTWTAELLAPGAGARIHVSKGGVLGLSFAASPALGKGTLEFFYRAADLARLV